MKKLLIAITVIIILAAFPCMAQAEQEFDAGKYLDVGSYLLIDNRTGDIILQKDADKIVYPSSTTKLMTALLLIEEKGLDGEITVGPEVNVPQGSSLMGLSDGETVTIKDLFYGLMLCSGNDAANALAVYVAGSVDDFVNMMNARAQELGMDNTHYVNTHGLFISYYDGVDESILGKNHYTTAADMVKLARECSVHPAIMEAAATKTYDRAPTNKNDYDEINENTGLSTGTMEQANRLLYTNKKGLELGYDKYIYEPATGMKTGYVERIQPDDELILSYGCLVASAKQGETELIAVIFGDLSEKALLRWELARDLFEYGFDYSVTIDLAGYILPVYLEETVSGYAENDPQDGLLEIRSEFDIALLDEISLDRESIVALESGEKTIGQEITLDEPLQAPIAMSEELGVVRYMLDGAVLCSAPLKAARQVYPIGEEDITANVYGLPKPTSNYLWLYILIPVAGSSCVFLVVLHYKKKQAYVSKRRSGVYPSRFVNNNDGFGMQSRHRPKTRYRKWRNK